MRILLETVKVEAVSVTPGYSAVVPSPEDIGCVAPRLSFPGTRVSTKPMIPNTGPVVLRRMITVGVWKVAVPVITVLAVFCGGLFTPVLCSDTSETVHVPDAGGDVTLLSLCFTDVTEGLIGEIGSIWVLTVMIWYCFVSQRGLLPIDTRLARFRSTPDRSMELPPLVQAAEHIVQ